MIHLVQEGGLLKQMTMPMMLGVPLLVEQQTGIAQQFQLPKLKLEVAGDQNQLLLTKRNQ